MRLIKKLHKIGEYSYSLIVPKEWLLRHNRPSEVEVRVKRNRLIIIPMKTKKELKDANKRQ
jgi:antitoxin component of MazEF toxin-antitoxin module